MLTVCSPSLTTASEFRPSGGAIELRSLTVSNLADRDDKRLTSSPAFKAVLSSPSFVDLKMLVTDKFKPLDNTELALHHPDKYNFFESLPATWLAPVVTQNLRTLSLYYHGSYWGWCPKLDFRLVNPAPGGGGFPNLRVLALGHYVFSHD